MFDHISIGDLFPEVVRAIIEIPCNTFNKYEYDEDMGIIKLDRVLHSPMHYPVDYGFIPETRSEDGDHLDIMIMTKSPVFTGCLLDARPLGVLIMKDECGRDEKILAVPKNDPYYNHIRRLSHVSPHLLLELEHFFTQYKHLEGKKAKVEGWQNRSVAYKIIKDSFKVYQCESQNRQLSPATS